jgi:hypothetical protein
MSIYHMEEGARAAYEAARDECACEEGLEWLEEYGKDDWHVQPHAMGKEYVRWALENIPEHVPEPTHEQIERGLMDEDPDVRYEWAHRPDFTPTPEQVERGLADECWFVRLSWAERPGYAPTPQQIERGMVDEDNVVRFAWEDRISESAT